MKEINIAKTLMSKRKEKGINQEELAAYIGVSKASVSKWETGQSYPDITFLPQLATYFNISIDELMGYSPQMTKSDIKKMYHRLSVDFSKKPFEEVYAECQELIKKYYSCFPLLLQMVVLLMNHFMLSKDNQSGVLHEIIVLCNRIKTESIDVWQSKQANSMEALSHLILNEPIEVLELLDESIKPRLGEETLLASAYQMLGNTAKAKEALQVSMYQSMLSFVDGFPMYLSLYQGDAEGLSKLIKQALSLTELYDLNRLRPDLVVKIYLVAAQGYVGHQDYEAAMDMLQLYADMCTENFFPLTLHGNEFFDSIDDWIAEFELGKETPREEKVIKQSMLEGAKSPVYEPLKELARYKSIIGNMKVKLGVL
ncbi:MAG: helix-turn-helix transcriptional regulator [Mobilitalea sp.]